MSFVLNIARYKKHTARQATLGMWNLWFIPDSNNLPEVQLIVVDLCNKDCSHRLVERGPVHVDGGSHRQHKPGNPPVHVVVLQQALERDRQRGWTAQQRREAHIELLFFLENRNIIKCYQVVNFLVFNKTHAFLGSNVLKHICLYISSAFYFCSILPFTIQCHIH